MIILLDDKVKHKYNLIMSDPAWRQSKGGKKAARPNTSGTELDYNTLSLEDIKIFQDKAKKLCENNHNCFLWTIDKYLHDSEKMMEELGYKLHARMIWNKVTGIPAAFTIRFGHEYLLWYYHGKLMPIAKAERGKIHSVFTEQVMRHSQKPEIAFKIIERLYPSARKLEMYSRRERVGWDCWGNQVVKLKRSLIKGG